MPHFFLLQIYTKWYIFIVFSYSSKQVGFRSISMSFLKFLSQKTYSRWIFTTRGCLKQTLSKKTYHIISYILILLVKSIQRIYCREFTINIWNSKIQNNLFYSFICMEGCFILYLWLKEAQFFFRFKYLFSDFTFK